MLFAAKHEKSLGSENPCDLTMRQCDDKPSLTKKDGQDETCSWPPADRTRAMEGRQERGHHRGCAALSLGTMLFVLGLRLLHLGPKPPPRDADDDPSPGMAGALSALMGAAQGGLYLTATPCCQNAVKAAHRPSERP